MSGEVCRQVDDWSAIMHKGNSNDERSPSIYFAPDSQRLHVTSASEDDPMANVESKDDLPAGASRGARAWRCLF